MSILSIYERWSGTSAWHLETVPGFGSVTPAPRPHSVSRDRHNQWPQFESLLRSISCHHKRSSLLPYLVHSIRLTRKVFSLLHQVVSWEVELLSILLSLIQEVSVMVWFVSVENWKKLNFYCIIGIEQRLASWCLCLMKVSHFTHSFSKLKCFQSVYFSFYEQLKVFVCCHFLPEMYP